MQRVEAQQLPNAALSLGSIFAGQDTVVLGRIGSMECRLAASADEIQAAQELRYRVFFGEIGSNGGAFTAIEADEFDPLCDHLIVIDTAVSGPEELRIVGTYRLLRQERTARSGFYSQGEFDIAQLTAQHPDLRFVELGRSCVLPEYRNKRTIELLWQGLWAYVRSHKLDVMVGCASFHGTVPARDAEALSYLAHFHRAAGDWRVSPLPSRHHEMDLMPVEAIDQRRAFAALPTLIKGYLRCGAKVGDGCVIDHEFGTVDVFMVMPVKEIGARYISYYGGESQKLVA